MKEREAKEQAILDIKEELAKQGKEYITHKSFMMSGFSTIKIIRLK